MRQEMHILPHQFSVTVFFVHYQGNFFTTILTAHELSDYQHALFNK
jgi:hypothetical protein